MPRAGSQMRRRVDAATAMRKVASCINEVSLRRWEDFFAEHRDKYQQRSFTSTTSQRSSGEYDLYEKMVYDEWVLLIEQSFENELEVGWTTADLLAFCAQGESEKEEAGAVFTILAKITEFETFADFMRDTAKQEYVLGIFRSWYAHMQSAK
jgi:maltooligosyltrehalose synthase